MLSQGLGRMFRTPESWPVCLWPGSWWWGASCLALWPEVHIAQRAVGYYGQFRDGFWIVTCIWQGQVFLISWGIGKDLFKHFSTSSSWHWEPLEIIKSFYQSGEEGGQKTIRLKVHTASKALKIKQMEKKKKPKPTQKQQCISVIPPRHKALQLFKSVNRFSRSSHWKQRLVQWYVIKDWNVLK